jgi:hypothetical protein
MDGLFPELPKELKSLSDSELSDLLAQHLKAAELIDAEDVEYLRGLPADEVIAQYEKGALSIMALREEVQAREAAAETYTNRKAEISQSIQQPKAEEDAGDGTDGEGEGEGEGEGDGAEGEGEGDGEAAPEPEAEAEVETPAEDREPALVASDAEPEKPRMIRAAPPPPAEDRIVVQEREPLAFIASGLVPSLTPGTKITTGAEMGDALRRMMDSLGRPSKSREGREDKYRVATLDFSRNFPDDRVLLASDVAGNAEKIAKIGSPYFGRDSLDVLLASGGLCAPLEPIYTIPQLAVRDRPVRDALPSFRAQRGGINVPTPGTIADVGGAITVITESEDALGGTFATKACLDFDCPAYTETAVTVISHCREFGNLVAMSWPEFVANQNDLTMAGHARIAEQYLLDRIKAQSVQVTGGLATLGALIHLVNLIEEAEFGIRSRLRMPNEARFQLLAPRVLLDMLLVDTVGNQFDRYRTEGDIRDYLASIGVDVTWYMDSPSSGTSQIADAAQAIGGIDGFPTAYQMAFFPQGTFLHLDMAELNLGIVRDSTLNSTNDFQIFGETFENVARIGPAQAAYWITATLCGNGEFPDTGTAIACS